MRGGDERSGSLFSYVDLEARSWQAPSAAGDARDRERGACGSFGRVLGAVRADGSTLDPAREASAGDAVAGVLFHDPFGAAVDGAARVRPPVLPRWFVGLGVDDAAWDHSTFSKNRERLLEGDLAAKLLGAVLAQPRVKRLLSTDHFSVDGTLVEAWASMKSFPAEGRLGCEPPSQGGGRNREADFPWPKADQRDARLGDRSRGAALSQRTRQGGQAQLHGPRVDGEPATAFSSTRLSPTGSQRPRGADRGAAHDRAARRPAEADHAAGSRQGLRRRGLRQ